MEQKIEETPAKHILQRKKDRSWFGTDYNLNLYHGCPHGCIYCDSRSECYRIEDFARVRVKKDAIVILGQELKNCRKIGVVATGSMSDPYNPLEVKYHYTRKALELLDRYGFGVAIATKGTSIENDIDLLASIARHSPVIVKITVTTPHDQLSQLLEPHAPSSSERLRVLGKLSEAGIFAGVLLMPVLPFLEDDPQDIRQLVQLCAQNGAKFIYPYFGVTLRDRQREYFLEKLKAYSPQIWRKYLDFEDNYQCLCPDHRLLWKIFCEECRPRGISWRMEEIIDRSQKPYRQEQLSLF